MKKNNRSVQRTQVNGLLLIISFLLFGPQSWAQQLSINAGAGSDFVFRGWSQTLDQPYTYLSADWDINSNIYTGAKVYVGDDISMPDNGSSNSRKAKGYFAHLGYFKTLTASQAIDLSLQHYGQLKDSVQDWKYSELKFSYYPMKSLALTASFSDNYYSLDTTSYFFGLDWQPQISRDFYAVVSLGKADMKTNTLFEDLETATLGLAFKRERLTLNVSHIYSDSNTTDNRLVFGINLSLY